MIGSFYYSMGPKDYNPSLKISDILFFNFYGKSGNIIPCNAFILDKKGGPAGFFEFE